jgi:uncharacterized protein (TIGR03067 family)
MKVTFKGNVVTFSQDPDQLTFTVDEEKKLLILELVFQLDDRQVRQKMSAIYELKGDTLRLCLPGGLTGPAPREFTSKNGQIVLTLQRDKKLTEK